VHGHEGGVLFWRDMVERLPKDQPFYGLQAQGVDGLRPPLTTISEMAAIYIKEMRKVQPQGPYYLGGYSMGGEIAFEMAQQLHEAGETIRLLVLFDTRNPQRPVRQMTRGKDGALIAETEDTFAVSQSQVLKRKIFGHYLRWSGLSLEQKLGYLFNQTRSRFQRFIIALFVKLIRVSGRRLPDSLLLQYLRESHSEALKNYAPSVYTGKVTLFRAAETQRTDPDDSPLGWKPLAAGGLEVHHLEASHEMMRIEYAGEVARILHDCLSRARGYG